MHDQNNRFKKNLMLKMEVKIITHILYYIILLRLFVSNFLVSIIIHCIILYFYFYVFIYLWLTHVIRGHNKWLSN